MARARNANNPTPKASGTDKEDIRCGFTQDYRMDRDDIARVLACGSSMKHKPVAEVEWDESTDRNAEADTYSFDENYKKFSLKEDY
jgi:hypothetical protein